MNSNSVLPMTLDQSIQKAAGELPTGWQIHVCVENGAGWVVAESPLGFETHIESCDESLAKQVDRAIAFAKAEAAR